MLERTIGKGSYGKVKLAIDLSDPARHMKRALKFIAVDNIRKPAHVHRLRRETALLRCLHHPHLVKLVDHFQTDTDLVLVFEYIGGQDLFDRITRHPNQRLSESEARQVFRQLVSALDYCHYHHVVHRDIKPENVMIGEGGTVKLIDFGFANLFDRSQRLETNCGSPLYASPEIVRGQPYVGPETDCWSLGIVLYAMLTGTLPFEDDALKVLYEKICRGTFSIPSHVSLAAQDLLRQMLVVDGRQRADISKVRYHPWTCEGYPGPPDSFIPIRNATATPMNQLNMKAMGRVAADFAIEDWTRLQFDVLHQPDSSSHSLYHLYTEQADREMYERRRQRYYNTASDWVRLQLTDNHNNEDEDDYEDGLDNVQGAKGLLRFDFVGLMRRVQAAQQSQPVVPKQLQGSIDSSVGSTDPGQPMHPQPIPHASFLQQAVGTLNSQFRRIRNIINGTSVGGSGGGGAQ